MKTILKAGVMMALPIISSCNRAATEPSILEESGAELRVSLNSVQSRTSAETLEREALVNNLQVLVFRGPEFDYVDAYAKVTGESEVTLNCTSGQRQVWAFVNCPDLSGTLSRKVLMSTPSYLASNVDSGFEMLGCEERKISGSDSISLNVNRIASRVVLRKLTRDFAVSALNGMSFSVTKVFLLNATTIVNYNMSGKAGRKNKTGYELTDKDVEKAFLVKQGSEFASSPGVYDKPLYLYAYPNDMEDGPTRLVVETLIGGETYYYPITLPELESNKSYEINNLVITRLGSDSPDVPVTTSQVKFSIDVADWTQVLVNSEGNEGGIYEI